MTFKSPAYCRSTAYRAFAGALGRVDRPGGLFRAAWAIAQHELPEADLASGEAAIDGLAAAVMKRVRSPSVDARLAHLHDVVFDVAGFRGNVEDYYAVGNSYLPEVLRTRRGLPIALALVYQCVAAKSGLVVHGVNAPGHFLVEVETPSQRGAQSMYVDPFHGGRLLTVAEALVRIDESKYDVVVAVLPSSLGQNEMANFVDYVRKGKPVLIFDAQPRQLGVRCCLTRRQRGLLLL